MKYSILIVDDDKLVNDFVVEALSRSSFKCKAVYSGEEAVLECNLNTYDIVLLDLKMKNMDGIDTLRQIKRKCPDTQVLMMTAYGTVETAVKAMKFGAIDFLLKPVSPDTLEHKLSQIAEILKLRSENALLKQDISNRFHNIVGKSKVMKGIFELISSIADARSTVLITGPSGTGKEMVARAIHYLSSRKDRPFIKLNCAAIPENLVEAELFGYEKGAFTDAKKMTRGRFELADGGTLLLDEISEMPLNLQSKLLRVIQEREFERIGSSETIAIDVRIVATSNRNLKECIAKGTFREDLFFRLNVIPIVLPPLNERLEDIPLLVNHFIEKYNSENKKTVGGLDEEAMALLMTYHWPGNVRELENLIERAVVTSSSGTLTDDDFPSDLSLGPLGDEMPGLKVPMKLEEGSRYLILKTLEKFGGNKTKAAEALGITTRTIRNKLAEYRAEKAIN
jgi:DNA-binding NtrC family response regulator